MNASCISQLAHCIRLLSCWPDVLLNKRGIQHKAVRGLSATAKFLFDTADKIAPCRQQMEKDQRWRAREQELLALLCEQHSAQTMSAGSLTHCTLTGVEAFICDSLAAIPASLDRPCCRRQASIVRCAGSYVCCSDQFLNKCRAIAIQCIRRPLRRQLLLAQNRNKGYQHYESIRALWERPGL